MDRRQRRRWQSSCRSQRRRNAQAAEPLALACQARQGGFATRPTQLGTGVAQLSENGGGSGKEVLEKVPMSSRVEDRLTSTEAFTASSSNEAQRNSMLRLHRTRGSLRALARNEAALLPHANGIARAQDSSDARERGDPDACNK